MIGNIVGGVIAVAVGFTMYPTIKEEVAKMIAQDVTITGTSLTLLQLTPQIFLGAVCLMSLTVVYQGLRNAGLVGGKYMEDYEIDMEEKLAENPEHKQTYYEYVQERLAVEKAMRRS